MAASSAQLAPSRPGTRGKLPSPTAPAVILTGGVIVLIVYVAALSWTARHYTYDLWGALIIGPILFAGSIPILRRAARREVDQRIGALLIWGLALKLLAAPLRYAVTSSLYGGVGDAHQYHLIGADLAPLFRHGTFAGWQGKVPGTGFIEILTGITYSIIGTTELGGYLFFSWLGFWGLYWFYRAFCRGVPDGKRVRYAALVLVLPSLLFWPSSIGKEAWMMLALGLTAYGIAALLDRGVRELPTLALGLAAVTIARPHLTLIVVCALAAAYLARPHGGKTLTGPLAKGLGIAVLIVLLVLSLGQAKSFFQAESATTTTTSLTQALDTAEARTAKGGSQFTATPVNTPLDFPQAAITVLYRPFAFEARNAQTLIASIDGTLMLMLTVVYWRGLRGLFRRLRSRPYIVFVLVYVVLFVVAFSRFANFGILARERVQVIPLLLVLVCLPTSRPRREGRVTTWPTTDLALGPR